MTDKRHNDHKHPNVTTKHNSGPSCTCAYHVARSKSRICEFTGEYQNGLVNREDVVGHKQRKNPHHWDHIGDEQCFVNVAPLRFNGGASHLSDPSSPRQNKLPLHAKSNSIPQNVLFPQIAHSLLFSKLKKPFCGILTNTKCEPTAFLDNMDPITSGKKHKSKNEDDITPKKSRSHRHHHRHHGHKSDGELERERLKARLQAEGKEAIKDRQMERSSSDRGKIRPSIMEKAPVITERIKRAETDQEREERRRKRRERKLEEKDKEKGGSALGTALAQLDLEKALNKRRGQGFKKERELRVSKKEKSHNSDPDDITSSRLKKEKQILTPKIQDSSQAPARPKTVPSADAVSRSKAVMIKHEKNIEQPKTNEKEKLKEVASYKSKNSLLGFILDKKEKMVECVSCLSDDIPRHQAAKLACNHYFCQECLKRIFHLSLTDPAHMPPRCCTNDHIPLKHVDRLLSYKTKKLWNKKYAEFTTSNRVYCPMRDCGEWIQPRDIVGKIGRCSRCKGKVCTICNGKAHSSSDCPKDEDLRAFVETVKAKGYQRCYNCRAFVELDRGCNHITCRCTAEFCYLCGEKWKSCDCPWFAYADSENEDDEDPEEPMTLALSDDENNHQLQVHPEREQREREAQIAEDEALARRLAQASLFLNEDTVDQLGNESEFGTNGSTFGSLRTGLRNSYRKLAQEYAEASRRDEEAREERIRERLQKLRDRDEALWAARREPIASAHREPRSATERRTRRHSEPRTSHSSSHSRPQTARNHLSESQECNRGEMAQQFLDNERAARIAKYIMGELDSLDDDFVMQPVPPLAETSQCFGTNRTRQGTTSAVSSKRSRKLAEHRIEGKSGSSSKTASGWPRSGARLDPTPYAASSVVADVAFPISTPRSSKSHTGDRHSNNTAKREDTNTITPPHASFNGVLPNYVSNDDSTFRRGTVTDLGYKFIQQQERQRVPTQTVLLKSSYGSASATSPGYIYNSNSDVAGGHYYNGLEGVGSAWRDSRFDRVAIPSAGHVAVEAPRSYY